MAPGWYLSPRGAQTLEWWDGTAWSGDTKPCPPPPPGDAAAEKPEPKLGCSGCLILVIAALALMALIGAFLPKATYESCIRDALDSDFS